MTEHSRTLLEKRVLILAPAGRDASMTGTVLAEHGIRCAICSDMAQLVTQITAGVGAILISEEGLPSHEQLHFLGERFHIP